MQSTLFLHHRGTGKIDAEWTNEAEAVYRYCESARLFIAKRIIKRKSAKIFHINNPSVTLPRATSPYTGKALGVKYK